MKTLLLIFILFMNSLYAQTINIAVAANVSYAIDELKKEFKKENPNTKVRVTLGSSGKLTAQISHGAPYGVFMSANMKFPEALYESKNAIIKPVIYAKGTLAYFSVKKRDFSHGIKILEDKNIKRIAIANPKTAPYGKATKEALVNAGIYENIKSKFVYGESISQTLSYAASVTDIGVIAKSSLYSSKMSQYKENVHWVEVESDLYAPISQGIVLLRHSKTSSKYKAFYDFILSEKAKNILKKYGYIV